MDELGFRTLPLLTHEQLQARLEGLTTPVRRRLCRFAKIGGWFFKGAMSNADQIRLSRAIYMLDCDMLETRMEGKRKILARKRPRMESLGEQGKIDGKETVGVVGFGPGGLTLRLERR